MQRKKGLWSPKKLLQNQKGNWVPHGVGRMTRCSLNSAYIYEGYFNMGVPNGFCRWIWDDSSMYLGHVINGKLHGQGKLIMGNCQKDYVQNGIWENGILTSGEIYHECQVERLKIQIEDTLTREIKKQMKINDLRHKITQNL